MDAPDTDFAGYPAKLTPDTRIPVSSPDFQLNIQMSSKFEISTGNGYKKTFLEILLIDTVIAAIWPYIRLFLVSVI
jgi:hypothetical protein